MTDERFFRDWPVASPKAAVALLHGLAEHSGRYEHVAARLMIAQQQRDLAELMRQEIADISAILDPDKVIDRLVNDVPRNKAHAA